MEVKPFRPRGFTHAGDAPRAGGVIAIVAKTTIAKQIRRPNKVQGVMGGSAKACIAGVR